MEEANVSSAETVIAVTNDDETNILASLLAKRAGSQRAITLVNNSAFEPIIPSLGIDVLVNPRNITVSTILQHVRRGKIHSVHTLQEGFGELIEAEAVETSSLELQTGTLVFFNGDKLRHRITSLGTNEQRIALTFEFLTNAEMHPFMRFVSNMKDSIGYFGFKQVFKRPRRG